MKAPFTPEQVENLNHWQNCGVFHPFTCLHCGTVLVATTDGWECTDIGCEHNKGDKKQDWAHDVMADKAFLNSAIDYFHPFHKKDEP